MGRSKYKRVVQLYERRSFFSYEITNKSEKFVLEEHFFVYEQRKSLRKWFTHNIKKFIAAGLVVSILGMGLTRYGHDKNLYSNNDVVEQFVEKKYSVKKGDCLWDIVKENWDVKNNKDIIEKVDYVASLNNRYSLSEYEKKRSLEMVEKKYNPHFLEVDEELIVERKRFDVKDEDDNKVSLDQRISDEESVVLGGLTSNRYIEILESLVLAKNEQGSLGKVLEKNNFFSDKSDVIEGLQKYQEYYQSRIVSEHVINCFDQRIACKGLQSKMVFDYQHSNVSLEQLAKNYEKEFGMKVSASTISRVARKKLKVKSRKNAKAAVKKSGGTAT